MHKAPLQRDLDSTGFFARMWNGWERFWFTPAHPWSLGLIRIFAGLIIFYVTLDYSRDLQGFVGTDAWVDKETMNVLRHTFRPAEAPMEWTDEWGPSRDPKLADEGWPMFSIYFHLTDPDAVVLTHVAILVIMFLFTIGFCTRFTAVLTWMGSISYIQRAPTTLFGMDTITTVVLLYLMIAPSGAAFSVDRLLSKWWARRKGRPEPTVQPSILANFATRLMQIHFCIIYFASGLSKLQGPAWWSGWSIWGTMANYSFAPMYSPAYLALLKLIAGSRWLFETIMIFGSYATLAIEISFIYLVWRPKWRPIMICASIMLHTGIAIVMGLATFSLAMMALVLCFVPPAAVKRFVDQWQDRCKVWFNRKEKAARPKEAVAT